MSFYITFSTYFSLFLICVSVMYKWTISEASAVYFSEANWEIVILMFSYFCFQISQHFPQIDFTLVSPRGILNNVIYIQYILSICVCVYHLHPPAHQGAHFDPHWENRGQGTFLLLCGIKLSLKFLLRIHVSSVCFFPGLWFSYTDNVVRIDCTATTQKPYHNTTDSILDHLE